MTTRYTISIHCDRCGDWVETEPAAKPTGIVSAFIKQIKKQGWSRVTNSQFTDLCPTCLVKSWRVIPNESACPTCGEDGGTTCGAVNCTY